MEISLQHMLGWSVDSLTSLRGAVIYSYASRDGKKTSQEGQEANLVVV